MSDHHYTSILGVIKNTFFGLSKMYLLFLGEEILWINIIKKHISYVEHFNLVVCYCSQINLWQDRMINRPVVVYCGL